MVTRKWSSCSSRRTRTRTCKKTYGIPRPRPPPSLSKPATQEDDGSYKALCSYPSLLSPQQKGMTALNLSALNGHDQCLNLLIKAGARLDLKDNWGDTALASAKEENHPKCVALLEAANAP